MYRNCHLCPRACGVDRTQNQRGFCGGSNVPTVALYHLHKWEEPCLSGVNGSGTVFFSGCNLKCVYCQNNAISRHPAGEVAPPARLCEIFTELAQKGAHNINLVTPTHYLPDILEAISLFRRQGYHLPIVYNCGGYESGEALEYTRGKIDVFLPDFKYCFEKTAKKYSACENYTKYALSAIEKMVSITDTPCFSADGMLTRGVMVRHLLLPGMLYESKQALKCLYEHFGNRIFYSIMRQYTPMSECSAHFPELAHPVSEDAYNALVDYADSLGIKNAYIQTAESVGESFIPQFRRKDTLK